MFYTDNPELDFMRYDAEQQAQLDRLPRCEECEEPIQGDFCYEVNGSYICENCLNDNHLVFVEDVID